MNKEEKKKIQNGYRRKLKEEFDASLPMPREWFQQLFDYLNQLIEEEENKCEHNFNMTTAFLKENHCPVDLVLNWLSENGAGCDCEVIFNVEERFEWLSELLSNRTE